MPIPLHSKLNQLSSGTTKNKQTNKQTSKSKKWTTQSAGKDAEQLELSCVADRNANWYKHLGKQFDSFLYN